jgi:hypothetical protein
MIHVCPNGQLSDKIAQPETLGHHHLEGYYVMPPITARHQYWPVFASLIRSIISFRLFNGAFVQTHISSC